MNWSPVTFASLVQSLTRPLFSLCLLCFVGSAAFQVRAQTLLYPVQLDGRWGFVDRTGKLAIPTEFDLVAPFSEGLAAVKIEGKWGYVDQNGHLAVSAKFSTAGKFSEGLAAVCSGHCGYVDRRGRTIIKQKYLDALDFSGGAAAVWYEGGWGYIDRTGAFKTPPCFQHKPKREEWIIEWSNLSLADSLGMDVARATLRSSDRDRSRFDFSEGLALASADGARWGFITASGTWFIEPKFVWAGPFNEGVAPVQIDGSFGFVNQAGAVVIPARFQAVLGFSHGLAAASMNDKWGFINRPGRWVIEPQFDEALSFSEGLASVEVDGQWGMIDQTGKYVLPLDPSYLYISPLKDGLASVYLRKGDEVDLGLIDRDGNIVWRSPL